MKMFGNFQITYKSRSRISEDIQKCNNNGSKCQPISLIKVNYGNIRYANAVWK